MAMQSINPATGEELQSYEEMTPAGVEDAITKAHETFLDWRRIPFSERATLMRRAADVLRAGAPDYARLMAQEMGKPIKDGVSEIQKCALNCDFYAENAETFLAQEPMVTDGVKSFVTFNPLGVVLAIMPWNFPFWSFVSPRLA